jgi:hypothetical protein
VHQYMSRSQPGAGNSTDWNMLGTRAAAALRAGLDVEHDHIVAAVACSCGPQASCRPARG